MRLQLLRPLVFFDLETTGVNISTDRIVEISLVKQLPDGCTESKTWRVKPVSVMLDAEGNVLRETVMSIPAASTAVHHITDEDVAHCRTFHELAPEVLAFIKDCDLAGYNSNHFDVPMLQEELLRNGFSIDLRKEHHFVDAFVIFQKHTPRTLTAAYKHYCGKDLEDAHSANADTEATREVLLRQMEVHPDVPTTIEALEQYTTMQQYADMAGRLAYDADGRIVFNFGKHKGRSVREVFRAEGSYYSWMMDGDFPLYTKQIITEEWEAIKEERRTARMAAAATKLQDNAASAFPKPHVAAPAATPDALSQLAAKYGNKPKLKPKQSDGQQSLF